MHIYQVYHKKELESCLLNKSYIIPYYTQDEKGINHLQKVLNEFVCQYYVYKYENYNADDVVGFCHYRRFFNMNKKENIIEKSVKNNHMVYGLYWFNIKGIIGYNDKQNWLFDTLKNYIEYKYPEKLDNFQKMNRYYKTIRYECFICRYDDFCKYVEFILGYFKYMGIDFETCNEQFIKDKIDNNKFIVDFYYDNKCWWYILPENHYRKIGYIIELLCGVYWSLTKRHIRFI